MSTTTSLHYYGYDVAIEEAVPVEELHQARCTLCDWRGEEHDSLSWKDAEAEAVEHFADEHADPDDDEDEV